MTDKKYCMSSYMAFRYIAEEEKDFYDGMKHKNIVPIPDNKKILVRTAKDIDEAISAQFDTLKRENKRLGILLSGGMDSAILASYMEGADAYTFRFLNGNFQSEETKRAEYYASFYGLNLHYVDISWEVIENTIDELMQNKAAPVHSIEPQILAGARQAKADGIEQMIIGESSDLIFGGMDQLLSKDWEFDEFVKRYMFTDPEMVLENPVDMRGVFEKYRCKEKIDFLRFMDEVFAIESSSSYLNAFQVAPLDYLDPYAKLKMQDPLDLHRIRSGESKYLIRELFSIKYPEIPVPNKVPMPRPVDIYFEDWRGPVRPEFKKGLDMNCFTGNQKWQMYCLERFLENYDPAF